MNVETVCVEVNLALTIMNWGRCHHCHLVIFTFSGFNQFLAIFTYSQNQGLSYHMTQAISAPNLLDNRGMLILLQKGLYSHTSKTVKDYSYNHDR